MKRSSVVGAFLLLAGTAGVASAQDTSRVGVAIMAPRSLGVVWDVTSRVSLRPDFNFSRSTADAGGNESSSTSLSFGLAGLFYLDKTAQAGIFLTPRAEYFSAKLENPTSEFTTDGLRFSLAMGAEYSPVSRIGFFGESGLAYSMSSTDQAIEVKNRSLELRSVIGVIIRIP